MKSFFFILTLLLALIFTPFLFAVDVIESVSEISVFNVSVIDIDRPEVFELRGYAGSQSNACDVTGQFYIYLKNNRFKSPAYIYEMSGGSLDMIPETHKNYKEGDSYQTDRTV